jgi:hypothetical protein
MPCVRHVRKVCRLIPEGLAGPVRPCFPIWKRLLATWSCRRPMALRCRKQNPRRLAGGGLTGLPIAAPSGRGLLGAGRSGCHLSRGQVPARGSNIPRSVLRSIQGSPPGAGGSPSARMRAFAVTGGKGQAPHPAPAKRCIIAHRQSQLGRERRRQPPREHLGQAGIISDHARKAAGRLARALTDPHQAVRMAKGRSPPPGSSDDPAGRFGR